MVAKERVIAGFANPTVIQELHRQMRLSMVQAMNKSSDWQRRSAAMKLKHGEGTTEARIAIRDDFLLKDLMSGYVWHRDHARFCADMIRMLMDSDVNHVVR